MNRRPVRMPTAYSLRAVTERYLAQRTTTSSHLRRLLLGRVRRAVEAIGGGAEQLALGTALVDEEIARLVAARLLDDATWAEHRVRSLIRKGNGARVIRQKLAAKGLVHEQIDQALSVAGPDAELQAAATYARKRRIGPWRREPVDRHGRSAEVQRMGRAGFGYAVAVAVVDGVGIAALGDS